MITQPIIIPIQISKGKFGKTYAKVIPVVNKTANGANKKVASIVATVITESPKPGTNPSTNNVPPERISKLRKKFTM